MPPSRKRSKSPKPRPRRAAASYGASPAKVATKAKAKKKSTTATAAAATSPSTLAGELRNFWEFMYPHTIIGTVLSIVVNSELALRDHGFSLAAADGACPAAARTALAVAIVSALAMNGYIVGINQCFDVEIDRLNKPYLPLASGAWTLRTGWNLALGMGALSLAIAMYHPAASTPLLKRAGVHLPPTSAVK